MTRGAQAGLGLAREPLGTAKPGRFLMLVKTYPSPSTKYGETVCCAGSDVETRDWIRMYPVNFRSLDQYAKFKKWQFIEATWSADNRESVGLTAARASWSPSSPGRRGTWRTRDSGPEENVHARASAVLPQDLRPADPQLLHPGGVALPDKHSGGPIPAAQPPSASGCRG